MSERSLNAYINRRMIYLFVILVIVVLVTVFFLVDGFLGKIIDNYIHELTVGMIFSSLEQIGDTFNDYENVYDRLLTKLIDAYHLKLRSAQLPPEQLGNSELNIYFQEVLENHEAELALLGLTDQSNNTYFYLINQNGVIIGTNDEVKLNQEIPGYGELTGSFSEELLLEIIKAEEDNYLWKNAYLPLDDFIIKISLPLDDNIYEGLFQSFKEIQNKFVFLSEISIFTDLDKPASSYLEPPTPEDISNFRSLSHNVNSIRKNLDRNSFIYYLCWENKQEDQEYINREPYYIKLVMDYSDNISIISRTINIVISIILVLAILAIFLVNRGLSKEIITPFIYLAENMSKLGRYGDLSNIDERLDRTNIKEVNMLLASYQEMTGELSSSFQELKAINEELEDSYRETSVLAENLHNVIQVATKLTDNVFDDKESFLVELFHVAKKLIPEADYGTVFVVENNKIKWLDAIGHNLEDIKKVPFDLDYYQTLDEVVYIKEVGKEENKKYYNKLLKKLLVVKKPISSFITVQLFVGDDLAGALNYDIAVSSNQGFSKQSIETIKAFGNLASAFLTMQSYKIIHERFQLEIILAIINMLEIHDSYTKGHSENVARISALLAREMGYSSEEIRNIEWAGLVHDIGKILISKRILNKKGVLTAEEYAEIKKHSTWGYEVLANSEELSEIALYVRHHHERWDGNGYPDELKGREIPQISRIIALADSWDTMRSDRVYRSKLSKEIAIQELKDNRGKQFDPEIVDIALKLIKEGKLS